MTWSGTKPSFAASASKVGLRQQQTFEVFLRLKPRLPVDRLLTETDGPFTMTGELPSTPSDVADVVLDLAALTKVAPLEMARTIRLNLRTILGG